MTDVDFLDELEARCVEADHVYGGPRRVSLTHAETLRLFILCNMGRRQRRNAHHYKNFICKQLRKCIEAARSAIAMRVANKLSENEPVYRPYR